MFTCGKEQATVVSSEVNFTTWHAISVKLEAKINGEESPDVSLSQDQVVMDTLEVTRNSEECTLTARSSLLPADTELKL